MLIDMMASYTHYAAHLTPIFERLPEELSGFRHRLGISSPLSKARVVLVAGFKDVAALGAQGIRTIYVEHGAGQSYAGDELGAQSPSYSASGGHRHVGTIGFIGPSQDVADRWQSAPSYAVGCPKLDKYRGLRPEFPDSICFTWHFDATVCPETRQTWTTHSAALTTVVSSLKAQGIRVFGHAHPRWSGELDVPMVAKGLELLRSEDEVFRRAGALVADNTSLIPEMASLGRPVAWLNAPFYRREINHGGRFWDWTKDTPTFNSLYEVLDLSWLSQQSSLAEQAYAYNDPWCTARAVDAVIDLVLDLT